MGRALAGAGMIQLVRLGAGPSILPTAAPAGTYMPRAVDDNCLDLVRRFEGLRTEAYRCPAGLWVDHWLWPTGDVQSGQRISASRAERLLRDDLVACAAQVEELVRVPLLDGQFGALVSFVFNAAAPEQWRLRVRAQRAGALGKGHRSAQRPPRAWCAAALPRVSCG